MYQLILTIAVIVKYLRHCGKPPSDYKGEQHGIKGFFQRNFQKYFLDSSKEANSLSDSNSSKKQQRLYKLCFIFFRLGIALLCTVPMMIYFLLDPIYLLHVIVQQRVKVRTDRVHMASNIIIGKNPMYSSFSKHRPFTLMAFFRRILLIPGRAFLQVSRFFIFDFVPLWKPMIYGTIDRVKSPITKYIFVEFNAWTYNGSDNLWASFMEELWSSVENEFSPFQVRMHRASISLVNGDDIDDNDWEEKERRRSAALFQFYVRSALTSILALSGVSIGTWVLVQNPSGESLYGGLLSIVLTPIPFGKQLYTFVTDILPILRGGPKQLLQDARIGEDFERRDFSQDMGFMGEVKREAEYLFDFLRVNKFYDEDKNTLHKVRLSIFVDDLDRCNSKTVVAVLEAVFLLLSESPISCYLAIDSRLVVASIDEHYTVHDRAEVTGYDFLEKIVQLPFCKYFLLFLFSAPLVYLNGFSFRHT